MDPTPTDWRKDASQELLSCALQEALDVLARIQKEELLEFWHEKVLTGLTQTASCSYRNLIAAWKEEGISAAAWSARCLLEAAIWMHYVTASKENARRFYMDWVNDVSELLKKMADNVDDPRSETWKADSPYKDLDFQGTDFEVSKDYVAILQTSSELMDKDYLRISAIAKDFGHAPHFSRTYKVLSKFAHPTAFSVLSMPSERSRTNTSVFVLDEGSNACMRSVAYLNAFLRTQNLPTIF